ncbi:MAG TPA: ABC transporter permease [Phycisphaerales bacterium]|nr:ABC transporter permease [Phycisphaerales bacterium]HMP37664.1 ABC transporter permease [Phycisphaerales bacterium]
MNAEPQQEPGFLLRGLAAWGAIWIAAFELVGGLAWLLRDVAGWVGASLVGRARIGRAAMVTQMVRVGVRSIAIVMLVSACIGVILALQMAPPLREFGQVDKTANIIGVAVFRELGPLIAAIVLTGFAGAAIAAEIGTMVVGEEIEALEAQALDPIRFLVVPRVIATIASLVVLTVIGDLTSVIAGGAMGVWFLDVPYSVYRDNTLQQLAASDFLTGLIKAAAFGGILGSIACYNGLRVTGGAEGVGRATTSTVVQTIVTVVLADLLFTALFYALGWG